MVTFKKAAAAVALAAAGVVTAAGAASAAPGPLSGDNSTGQAGLIPVNALNNVNVSPNVGCLANRPLDDLTAQGLIGLVPIGVSLNHLLQEPNLNLLSNGNVTTNVHDDSCTSNQGSSQAGNDSHGSTGAGSSVNSHGDGNAAGSGNASGNGAGGLLGTTGLLGSGVGAGVSHL